MLTDKKINELLKRPKRVLNPGAKAKTQRGSEQTNYELECEKGELFTLYVRQNTRLSHSFSCGLLYRQTSRAPLTLTRYNGSCHTHSNPLEKEPPIVGCCHIHIATERYILAKRKPDHYATKTSKYNDLSGAFMAIIQDCNIQGFPPLAAVPLDEQLSLFDELEP